VIVFDTTTTGTNWIPRLVDDVTGAVGKPAAGRIYATVDEFAKTEGPDAQSLERVRRALADHPGDIVLCILDDHGVEISNVKITANVDNQKVDLHDLEQIAKVTTKYVLTDQKRRGKRCPAILTIIVTDDDIGALSSPVRPTGGDVPVLLSETFAEFEHDALMNGDQQSVDEVRSAMATNPGRLIIFMSTDTGGVVFVGRPIAEIEKAMEAIPDDPAVPKPYFYSEGQHGKRQ